MENSTRNSSGFIKTVKTTIVLACLILLSGVNKVNAQNVNIPNATFKSWVLAHVPHPTSTTNITVAEAAAFTGDITVGGSNISDLTGITAFTHITLLNCTLNNLTTLNVSGCTALHTLSCTNNPLTSLTVSGCPALTAIYCSTNELTSLNVSTNASLEYLYCYGNYITSLDLSNNPLLGYFDCHNNSLTSLNIKNGHNNILSIFDATENSLSCIKVDNVANANSYPDWSKDASASYSTTCGLAVDDFNNQSLVDYAPNPFSTSFSINIKSLLSDKVQITAYDMIGRTIETRNLAITDNNVIEMGNNYPAGVYNIIVKQGDTTQSFRVIKK